MYVERAHAPTDIMPVSASAKRVVLCEPLERALMGFLHLDFAIPRRRVRVQRVNELVRRHRHVFDGLVERGLIHFRRLGGSTELANELERGCANLIVGRGWLKVGERFDVPAHGAAPLYQSVVVLAVEPNQEFTYKIVVETPMYQSEPASQVPRREITARTEKTGAASVQYPPAPP
jgi:hypothetical protein